MVRFLPYQTFPLNLQVNKKNLCMLLQCDIILYESVSITA